MTRLRGSTISLAVAVVATAFAYVTAERVARRAVYPALDPQAQAQVARLTLDYLPPFLRRPLERRVKIAQWREQLLQADAPESYFKIVAELSSELSQGQASNLYEQALDRYPNHPLVADALITLVVGGERDLSQFYTYADARPAEMQPALWSQLLGRFQAAEIDRSKVLDNLMRRELVGESLVSAYAEIESSCVKKGNLRDADRAVVLQRACIAEQLRQAQLKAKANGK